MMKNRKNDRKLNEIRNIEIINSYSPYAEGSCLIKFGNTRIICTASVDEKIPPWLRNSGKGWITAEYSMLPRSTHTRIERDINKGKLSGRTQEIQRLIGRSLRSVTNLKGLKEIQIKIDCDVILADGGTRTASITGAWVALNEAIRYLISQGKIETNPITDQVAAVSCGIVNDEIMIDLDYDEDSAASVDANFVLTESGGIVEIQATSEKKPINKKHFLELYDLASKNISIIFQKQLNAIHSK